MATVRSTTATARLRATRIPSGSAALAAHIASPLGERDSGAQTQIRRLVRVLGRERALALLADTARVEAMGGLLVPDGSRCRTPGGVFFHLARLATSDAER